jgi:hypothetical protein
MRGDGLLNPSQALIIERAQSQPRLDGVQALVVVHHHTNVRTHLCANASDDCQVFWQCGIANLRLDRLDTAFNPGNGLFDRFDRPVVPDASVDGQGPALGAKQPHKRQVCGPSERIPHRHVNEGRCNASQSLWTEQPEARGKQAINI